MKEIEIPASVKKLEYAFCYCSSLTDVTILGEDAEFDPNCFAECAKLKTVTVHKRNKKRAKKVLAELKRKQGIKPKLLVVK